jgi:hypothetical protein
VFSKTFLAKLALYVAFIFTISLKYRKDRQ